MLKFKPLLLLIASSVIMSSCGIEPSTPDDPDDVTSTMTISATELSLAPAETATLTATVTPASTEVIVWESSDSTIATIFKGIVTAQKSGKAIITARCGDLSKQCLVTIESKPYQLVWSDEFDGTDLDLDTWNIEQGATGWGNQEKQNYTSRAENLRIEDGHLVIEARRETLDGKEQYTSARINTKNKRDFTYGRIEARICLPSGGGTWPAFWTLGYGGWPTCGEIDIMEHVGNNPTATLHAVHTAERNGNNGRNWSASFYKEGTEGQFHTFAIEWEQKIESGDDCINFFVDDNLSATLWEPHNIDDKSRWPFFSKQFIILNMAIGGNLGGTIDDNCFDQEVKMLVDYVRVYQRK